MKATSYSAPLHWYVLYSGVKAQIAALGACLNLAFNQFNAALIPSRLGNLTYYVSFLAVCYMVAFRIY
ncbi:hypothetical protein Patl1_31391 [Pistacia atlantica]|uniref:Uncharacterized protein n=1 Tax=Pistacia atlantica TaxID=434234 RepID=A0ACC1AM65_9ROSI|nr:hypothetical protein Patl1_31391 [Pistacia atlantica]